MIREIKGDGYVIYFHTSKNPALDLIREKVIREFLKSYMDFFGIYQNIKLNSKHNRFQLPKHPYSILIEMDLDSFKGLLARLRISINIKNVWSKYRKKNKILKTLGYHLTINWCGSKGSNSQVFCCTNPYQLFLQLEKLTLDNPESSIFIL